MRHLEDEDIARMIEGKISKKERETFLRHLSECGSCLTVYTETLKFVEREKKEKVPWIEKIKTTAQRFWQSVSTIFPNKIPIPVRAFAVLVIIVLMGAFGINYLSHRGIENNKIGYIDKSVMEIENREIQAFSGSKGEIYAALRTGIFVEDLSLVVNIGGNKDLKSKIIKMLNRQLKIFAGEKSNLSRELENIEKKNLEEVVQGIRELFQSRSYTGLFQFGRFLEQSILSTYEKKTPKQEDIGKYRRILQKYQGTMPLGIFKELKKLEPTTGAEESKTICMAIKEILLE